MSVWLKFSSFVTMATIKNYQRNRIGTVLKIWSANQYSPSITLIAT